MSQQRRKVVNDSSVHQHIRSGTYRSSVVAWKCAASTPVSVEQQEDCLTVTVPWQRNIARWSWFWLWELAVSPSRLIRDADDSKQRQQVRRVGRGSRGSAVKTLPHRHHREYGVDNMAQWRRAGLQQLSYSAKETSIGLSDGRWVHG